MRKEWLTPFSEALIIRFGHNSLSIKTIAFGFQWSRKAPTAVGVSTGANWFNRND